MSELAAVPMTHAEVAAEMGRMIELERGAHRLNLEFGVKLSPATREHMDAAHARRIAALAVGQAYFRTLAGLTEASMACAPLALMQVGR